MMNKSKLKEDLASNFIGKFREIVPDEETVLKIISEIKWKDGFHCLKCGSTNYCSGKSPFSRRCTRCKKEESATAHTIFHRCKIPLNTAMEIAFLVCNVAAISSYQLSRQLEMRHMTCYSFQKKVIDCMNGETDEKLLKSALKEINSRIELN